MRPIVILGLLAALSLAACDAGVTPTADPATADPTVSSEITAAGAGTTAAPVRRPALYRLVTLGDAYTAGYATDQPRRDSWPQQLVDSLARSGMEVRLTNLAVRGYSSGQVLEEQLDQVAPSQPDVVTLQVGINDLLYGEMEWYRGNVETILDRLLESLRSDRVFVVTTPDDALDGAGEAYGAQAEVRAAIGALNATLADAAAERGVGVIDIGVINGLGEENESLVVEDGPYSYPTAKQYAGWVEVIGPSVHDALSAVEP